MNEEKKDVVQPTTAEAPASEEKVQEQPTAPVEEAPAPVAEAPKEEEKKEEVKAEEPKVEAPAEPAPEPKQEIQAEQPAPEVKQEVPAEQPAAPAAPVETAPVEAAPAPEEPKVEAPAEPAPVAAAVTEPAPAPQVIPQPASEPVPQPQVVPQPVQEAPVQPTPVAQEAPKEEASIVPEVAPQQVAPTPPQGETITEAPALNPIANEAAPVATPTPAPQAETNTVAPSNPLNTSMDTNVGFVAVGEDMKKKKNVPLIVTIVVVVLAGLAALGWFVIYPMIVTKMTKPKDVYYAVIDNTFKEVGPTVDVIAHNKAIFDIEAQIDTNIEALKDLNGFTYAFNGGFDPTNKKLQGGVKIIDTASQEHSAYIYVKENRQYLRLSSYRELIYYNPQQSLQPYWDQVFEATQNINSEEYNKVINKFSELLKGSILESKLTKEEASVTINGKSYKVLNSKYKIDNETVTSMAKTIRDGFASDDEVLEIIAKNTKVDKETIKKKLESIDFSQKILEDDEVYYLNVYTYSVKNTLVGIELVEGENSIHYYTMDDYFEVKLNSTNKNEETGKEDKVNLDIVGKKVNGKTNVTVTYNNKQYAKFVVTTWDEKTKDFTYEINYGEQVVTGNVKLVVDTNDTRSKLDLNLTINVDNQYFKLSLSITNDWTSEVANVNAGTAKELNNLEVETKIKEFITELKGTPLYKMFATEAGEIDPSTFNYRFNGNKAIEQPVEANNGDINSQPGNEA